MTAWNWKGIFIMKNKYILLGLNYNNEIRADVNLTIKSLNITSIEDVNIKIDTGCPYTSIPILKLGISAAKAQQMKQIDCRNDKIKKEISFGVNDTREKRDADKEKFRNGQYMEIKSITFRHGTFGIDFGGVCIENDFVKISYDRTGNILIGMDILLMMKLITFQFFLLIRKRDYNIISIIMNWDSQTGFRFFMW